MCVAITIEPGGGLSLDELQKMARANGDGMGLAWVEDGLVHWVKHLHPNLESVERFLKEDLRDKPRLLHFRLATAGGTKTELCHPFEIGPMAACKDKGSSQLVMIHNGHWGRWSEVHDLLQREGILPDKGPWSDTRLAAYLAHINMDWLNALGGKVATLSSKGEIVRHGDWSQLREGVMVSNNHWNFQNYSRGGYSGYGQWKGWEWDDKEERAYWERYHSRQTPEEKKEGAKVTALVDTRPTKRERKAERRNKSVKLVEDDKGVTGVLWETKEGKFLYYDCKTGDMVETSSPGTAKATGAVGPSSRPDDSDGSAYEVVWTAEEG